MTKITLSKGPRNLITDVEGIRVGNAEDHLVRTGVSVVLPDEAAVAAVDVRGGGPGTRETEALDPVSLVDVANGVVLSGGSVYGLDAAGGVANWLGARGRGYRLGGSPHVAPIVPAAILFDLTNGGDKNWGRSRHTGGWAARRVKMPRWILRLVIMGLGWARGQAAIRVGLVRPLSYAATDCSLAP